MKSRSLIAAFMLICFVIAGTAGEPPAAKDIPTLPPVEAAVNDSRLRGDMLIVNVIVGLYPLETEPYFVVSGGAVTLDGKPATLAAVNERVAKGRVRVVLHPRGDRYGAATDAEFTTTPSPAKAGQAATAVETVAWVPGFVPGIGACLVQKGSSFATGATSVPTATAQPAPLFDGSLMRSIFAPRQTCPGGVCPTPKR